MSVFYCFYTPGFRLKNIWPFNPPQNGVLLLSNRVTVLRFSSDLYIKYRVDVSYRLNPAVRFLRVYQSFKFYLNTQGYGDKTRR